jgi:hypothetical protein
MHFTGLKRLLAGCALLGALSGCAAPVIGGLTASQIFSLAGLSSTIMTGRDLAEHAVSIVTGKDCRFLETLFRNGRSFCETPNAVATKDDFHGVLALFDKKKPDEPQARGSPRPISTRPSSALHRSTAAPPRISRSKSRARSRSPRTARASPSACFRPPSASPGPTR